MIAPTDESYAETAGTWTGASGGFYGSYRTAATVTGSATATATWTFENLMLGEEYDVYISWTADETNGSYDAHFGFYKGSTGCTLVYEEDLDQTGDPTEESDFIDFSSAKFEKLASVTLSSGDSTTIVVRLANDSATSGKLVLGDAVYLVRKTAMSQSEYDEYGRLASTSDALGNETVFGYDVLGRQVDTTQADPDGAGDLDSPYLWRHYDGAGQMVASVGPDLSVTSVAYDGRGLSLATYAGSVVDDSTSEAFATTGTWTTATNGGLLGGYRTAASTNGGTATATATEASAYHLLSFVAMICSLSFSFST